MLFKKSIICLLIFASCLFATKRMSFAASPEASEIEKQEYKQERAYIKALEKSFKDGPVNNLEEYEKFADEIHSKWVGRNKEHYAYLMLEICKPLSSGRFNEDRQFILARKYALLALAEPNQIPLETELELVGHVISDMATPRAPKGQEWANRRKQDVEVRFHVLRRLIDVIDPDWDPNDKPLLNVSPPYGTTISAGASPEHIKDPKLRADYEAAIEKNKQKAERYLEQSRLRKWLKRFPKNAEEYMVDAYSKPPFNLEELQQYLKKYAIEEKTRARILDAVKKNMDTRIQKELTMQ
jgi:hypothetical protein